LLLCLYNNDIAATVQHKIKLFVAFLLAATVTSAIPNATEIYYDCGPKNRTFSIAGSSAVKPIARAWAEGYMKACPGIRINVITGGNSTTGANRVCNVSTTEAPVEIGTMSRNWNSPAEANSTNPVRRKFACTVVGASGRRNVTQIDVAIEALTITILRGGVAQQNCTNQMSGKGLTIDQIRWMFSNYTTTQLIASGWDKNVIPNDDHNETSHHWSELTKSIICPKKEIKLASPGLLSRTYEFFKEIVLPNTTEGLANQRPFQTMISDSDDDLRKFIETSSEEMYGDAIGYFGYFYYSANTILYGIPIQAKNNTTTYVEPTEQTILNNTFVPFSRRLYMNLLDSAVINTGPLIEYGMDLEGQALVTQNGFVQLPYYELRIILAQIGEERPLPIDFTPNFYRPTVPVRPPLVNVPVKPPSQVPVQVPVKPPISKQCGLFGLGIFCPLTLCGIFGKFLRLCTS
jgi:ABC-type phosphate transport system substrate-binding protein